MSRLSPNYFCFALPSISSVTLDNTTPTVGDVITATVVGSNITTKTYVWKADGTPISGETAAAYTATRADAMGKAILCEATAHNATGDSGPVESSATSLVTGAPVNTVAPVVTTDGANAPGGPATSGDTLSTTNGTWTGYPYPTFTYDWKTAGGLSIGVTTQTCPAGSYAAPSGAKCTVTGTNSVSAVDADSNTILVV